MRMNWIAAAVALACAGAVHAEKAAPAADPRIASILDNLGRVRPIESVALSPDGRHLAWTVKTNGKIVLELAELLRPESYRPVDDAVLRCLRL